MYDRIQRLQHQADLTNEWFLPDCHMRDAIVIIRVVDESCVLQPKFICV